MAAMLATMEGNGVTFLQVMAVCLPASFVASMIAAFVSSKQGCELQDDKVYLQRLQDGLVSKEVTKMAEISSSAKYSVLFFLLSVLVIVLFAAFPDLRPIYQLSLIHI